MTNTPKFEVNTIANGAHYGRFSIVGRRWSESVGEFIYGVFQIDGQGNIVSREMNMVESAMVAA